MNQVATRIGRYDFVTLLGEGGMSRVYLAVSRGPVGFNKLVVVKQLRPEMAFDREFVTMFIDEARIAARLSHPNVVQTYEVVEDGGQYLLAMEYLEGRTLAEILHRTGRANMPLEEHLWILTQVLGGLHYAHELADYDGQPLGVVHRDVSPSNVFVTYNGEVKLVDFGIAKVAGAISATQQGTVKGKLGYSAPEQFMQQPVDARADVFSAGVMLWEAAAFRRRKFAETRPAILEARIGGTEPKIREVRPEVPVPLAQLCDRATALAPDARPATALELQLGIERILEASPRRVGRREVSALVSKLFEADRRAMRKRIEEQIATMTAYAPIEGLPPLRLTPGMGVEPLVPAALEASVRRTPFGLPGVEASVRRTPFGLPGVEASVRRTPFGQPAQPGIESSVRKTPLSQLYTLASPRAPGLDSDWKQWLKAVTGVAALAAAAIGVAIWRADDGARPAMGLPAPALAAPPPATAPAPAPAIHPAPVRVVIPPPRREEGLVEGREADEDLPPGRRDGTRSVRRSRLRHGEREAGSGRGGRTEHEVPAARETRPAREGAAPAAPPLEAGMDLQPPPERARTKRDIDDKDPYAR
jgi:serine/threonine-protein kinase